jgi:hypothetical protein
MIQADGFLSIVNISYGGESLAIMLSPLPGVTVRKAIPKAKR